MKTAEALVKSKRKTKSLEERFWSKVDKSGDCWLWIGARSSNGYGNFCLIAKTKWVVAHRVAYELVYGPIDEGLELDHICRVLACVNPSHLEPVTAKENQRRRPNAEAMRTHCPQNHPYDIKNTYVTSTGARLCRTCSKNRKQQLKKETINA